jgi:hypothetical protein
VAITDLQLVDLVLAISLAEALALLTYHRITGRGLAPQQYLLNLVSGLCLMLALRSVVVGAPWPWLAICLLASGLAHSADLWRRWQRTRRA